MSLLSGNKRPSQDRVQSAGSQRYWCKGCRRKYMPEPTEHGYGEEVRQEALRLYVDGLHQRRIARVLKVSHQTIANWIEAYADRLPNQPPSPAKTPLEVNELTSCSPLSATKKRSLRHHASRPRHGLHRGLGCGCCADYEAMQAMLDRSPQAKRYFSDDFATYDALVYYPGKHRAMTDKSQTYMVESDNAQLRHYLARLVPKSRCFSRSLRALWRSIKLFVFAWNRRQLHKAAFPRYPAHVRDFLYP